MAFIRDLASLISRRSAALMAGALFALWELRHETEAEAEAQAQAQVRLGSKDEKTTTRTTASTEIQTTPIKAFENGGVVVSVTEAQDEEHQRQLQTPQQEEEEEAASATTTIPQRTKVAFNGSVMEHYPRYRATCQGYLDGLVGGSGRRGAAVDLVPAVESSLLGAAVALASAVAAEQDLERERERERESSAVPTASAPLPVPVAAAVSA